MFCGTRAPVMPASVCARNSSAAFLFANNTLRQMVNSMRFDEAVPNTPSWFTAVDPVSQTSYDCQGNYSAMCKVLGGAPKAELWSLLTIDGCCSGAWTEVNSAPGMVPGFPRLPSSMVIDSSMCVTSADCLGIDLEATGQLSSSGVSMEESGVPNLPVRCHYGAAYTFAYMRALSHTHTNTHAHTQFMYVNI